MSELFKLKMTRNKSGHLAEILCRLYMLFHGYRIIAHNFKCGTGKKNMCGEIDFIAKKKNTLYFCEVKQRKNLNNFLSALSSAQQKRIINGATYFMRTHRKYTKSHIEFDVFFVKLPFKIKRIKNALFIDKVQ